MVVLPAERQRPWAAGCMLYCKSNQARYCLDINQFLTLTDWLTN